MVSETDAATTIRPVTSRMGRLATSSLAPTAARLTIATSEPVTAQ